MKKRSIHLLITLFLIPVLSQAATKYETAYGKCVDEAGTMNNSVMVGCSDAVSLLAKKDITTFYKSIEAKTKQSDEEQRTRMMALLETGQKAWIQYRNKHCALSQLISVHESYCLMLVNSQRAEELKALAE